MHIPDGMLPVGVCAVGYAISGAALCYSLRRINKLEEPKREIPKASLVTAAFFTVSLISIPVPPSSVHFLLTGLIGALLGYYAFPAVLISLFFQAVMFQHGGITTLGINAVIMGIPAMISSFVYNHAKMQVKTSSKKNALLGFGIGVLGIGLSVLLFFLVLINFIPANIDVQAEKVAIYGSIIAHIPLILIEGVFTAFIFVYLKKVKPEVLERNE